MIGRRPKRTGNYVTKTGLEGMECRYLRSTVILMLVACKTTDRPSNKKQRETSPQPPSRQTPKSPLSLPSIHPFTLPREYPPPLPPPQPPLHANHDHKPQINLSSSHESQSPLRFHQTFNNPNPVLHSLLRRPGTRMQSENTEQTSVEADQGRADAADSFEPGAVQGADGGVRGKENLKIPGGGFVVGGGGFGERSDVGEWRAGVACCVDEDLAGFEASRWVGFF